MMDRSLHLILIVTSEVCLLCVSRSSEAVRLSGSYCAADEYYDGLFDRCVPCSAICLPGIESDFCSNNCPDYNKETISKQKHPLDSSREATAESDTKHDSRLTTSGRTVIPEVRTGPDVLMTTMTVVCVGLTVTVMLIVIGVISCRSCLHHSDDAENNSVTMQQGCCIGRQRLERQTDKHQHTDGTNDSSSTDSTISSPLKFCQESVSDTSERRSLLATTRPDVLSSSHDDVKPPVSLSHQSNGSGPTLSITIQCSPSSHSTE